MKVLVTGGAGYIGSHTCIELLNNNYEVVVVDNLCNSSKESLNRVQQITGKEVIFYQDDVLDEAALAKIFSEQTIDAVIHFAGLKAVGESVGKPLEYYQTNLSGTLVLFKVMRDFNVKNFVFSSSATVYGDPHTVPITEEFPLSATNPYGRSKLIIEEICGDLYVADKEWNIALLRYFNPVGAHKSGLIGEDPNGIPNNLIPYISQVAVGKREKLSVFGGDYDTPDGTGVRDYIHVVDLARGHIKALEKLTSKPGLVTYNLGTGQGYSVLEMVRAIEQASGKEVPYQIVARRPGDIATCFADPAFAEQEIGWKAEHDLAQMAEDTWRWQSNNPDGYAAK
ncbi:MAG: UDP-glucose 4-epimerase GalE [gamma proteobacterium symbiont of Lucinoma myriamae]|nr:UDP-glucose 4-epimerase GalE [gamma proteobacterium symbiont of Lucinoma myriamae]MCU7819311.1 UDP-glucose 4-epimerase GalE [gamma proteobacterium symbiont of Lucinoma myriamae]MCU7831728.1 UDP-glucose 4-epimerase GalE [gamma proteobacterium symbiont of Lucinoma myriamae]